MAALSGATGGPTSVDPDGLNQSSTSARLVGNSQTGIIPTAAVDPSGLVRNSVAAALKGGDRLNASADHGSHNQDPLTPSNPNKQPSYAKTVLSGKSSRPPPAFVSNLTAFHPVKRGNASFLKMPPELYQRRLSAFTYALIGRIFLPKKSTPRPLPDIKLELQKLFQTAQDWSLTPLGKGFFSLKFSSQDDQVRALRFSSWKLKLGTFFLREWKPNFDPYKEQTSITQLWVRLFHLPEEYWDPNFLVGIFRAVGNVVKLDGSTAAGMVGHFARALVEVDLSYPLAESVTIEGCSSTFVVEFGFENLPLYCSFCRYIGHSIVDCKSKKKQDDPDRSKGNAIAKAPTATAKKPAAANQHNARNRKEQTREDSPAVPTNNAFEALAGEDVDDALETHSAADLGAKTNPVRELVPLSEEAAKALEALKNRDFSMDSGFAEDALSDDAEVVFEEKQASEAASMQQISAFKPDALHEPNAAVTADQTPGKDDFDEKQGSATMQQPAVSSDVLLPGAAASPHRSQANNTSSEPPLNAGGPELSPKESTPETDRLSSDEEEEVQVDNPPMAAAGLQTDNTSSEFNARKSESPPKGSAMPSKTTPTDKDEPTTVVPSPDQIAGHKMSAAAKRRAKEALRKNRVRSSMKTRSRFDTSSDTLHVLPDKRGKSAQVPAASVGLPHGAKQSQLDDKIRTAMEQGKCPKAYVVDTGQPVKAMGFIANQRWGDVLDLAVTDKDFYDLMS